MAFRAWVGTRKGVFAIEPDNGGRWEIAGAHFVGDNATIVSQDPRDGAIYVALDHGHFGVKLHRSRDGGKTWQPIAAPVYPAMPEGREPDVHPMSGKPIPWTLKLVWSIEPGGPDEPGVLWCGTIPGGLFKSTDSGDSWFLVDSLWNDPLRPKWMGGGADLPGIHSICVDPRNSKHVSVAVSCGGVWHTFDGGSTWHICGKGMRAEFMPPELAYDPNSQDAHRLTRCSAAPDALWVQHHNGIFASNDNGASWREITKAGSSTFGFAVVVHPKDPATAWFVPGIKDEKRIPVDGKLVVTRTRDGGETFDVLFRGLPQQHAYDLVYRHGMDIDSTGERLIFGSTTGSLWVSENSGDDWQTVSTHLPPVYCVRFEASGGPTHLFQRRKP